LISLLRGLGLILFALALAGCATRSACGPAPYQDARARPPLMIPDGLDAPDPQLALRIPEVGVAAGRLASDPANCIIEPPRFFAQAGEPNPAGLPVRPSSVAARGEPVPAPGISRVGRDVAAFLNEWAAAWSRREADAWFQFYSADYAPAGYAGPDEWRDEQRSRFEIPATTRIDPNSVAVEPLPDGQARVRFIQRFGAGPDERAVLKEVILVPGARAGEWRITQERIVEVL
jgi:hypothetical protein